MGALLTVAVVACIPIGTLIGVWIGRSWSSLPTLRPGEVVAFRGPSVGLEQRLVVSEFTHDLDGATVTLRAVR